MPINEFRNGNVWIPDFDRGLIVTLGGQIRTILVKRDGDREEEQDFYVVNVSDADRNIVNGPREFDGRVPILFGNPDDVISPQFIPSYVLLAGDPVFAAGRTTGHAIGYEVGVDPPITVNGKTGFAQYEAKDESWKVDLPYDLHCKGRSEREVLTLAKYALRIYPPRSLVKVIDSLGEQRTYTVFHEGMKRDSEVTDPVFRRSSFRISLRVEAEWDLRDPYSLPGMTQPNSTVQPIA